MVGEGGGRGSWERVVERALYQPSTEPGEPRVLLDLIVLLSTLQKNTSKLLINPEDFFSLLQSNKLAKK